MQTHTRVARLRFAGTVARGADVVGPHGRATLTADRIVLCAGAIETAHLLMLSGIGEPGMLRAAGVPVRVALPVGTSFSDHAEWVLPTDWPVAPGRPVLGWCSAPPTISDQAVHRRVRGDDRRRNRRARRLAAPRGGADATRARGCLTLMSADPAVPPRIEHRYDSEPGDVAALARGAELARELAGGTTDAAAAIWSTSQHLCGTAPMGSTATRGRSSTRGAGSAASTTCG